MRPRWWIGCTRQWPSWESIRGKVPEIDHDLVREMIVERYPVVYQLMRDRIEIVAVLHSRQDLVKKFRERRRDA